MTMQRQMGAAGKGRRGPGGEPSPIVAHAACQLPCVREEHHKLAADKRMFAYCCARLFAVFESSLVMESPVFM